MWGGKVIHKFWNIKQSCQTRNKAKIHTHETCNYVWLRKYQLEYGTQVLVKLKMYVLDWFKVFLEEGTRFDPSKLSKVIAHGWGGGLHLGTLQLMMVVLMMVMVIMRLMMIVMVLKLDQMSTWTLPTWRPAWTTTSWVWTGGPWKDLLKLRFGGTT